MWWSTSKNIREELIGALIERGDKDASHRHQNHLLAVACLETSVELTPKVLEEVRKRLTKLVPPSNITEAKALSSAGDLAVPYLKYNEKYYSTIAVACVRCLAMIGSEAAIDTLKSYKHEMRQTVLRELLRAADSFDSVNYGREVLSYFTTTNLSLEHFSSLNEIGYMTSLISLRLYYGGSNQVTDLSPLANLTKLIRLSLIYLSQISDLSPLSKLTKLYYLNLTGCSKIKDISPLSNLINLCSLDLSGCSQVKDLRSISNLTNLFDLNLLSCSQINDLSPLSNLAKLHNLVLSSCSQINDLSPLSNLINLHNLSLSGCSQLEDLSPLSSLINLYNLNLSGCSQLEDLSPLSNSTGLHYLYLSGCSQVSDLSPLSNISNLYSLDLSGCSKVKDLDPLIKLKNLRYLSGISKEVKIPEELAKRLHKPFY